MKSNIRLTIIICGILLSTVLLLLVQPAIAQTENELKLRLSKDFGYSSGLGVIQGTFTLQASGPDNLVKVSFFIDEQEIGESNTTPFKIRFNTDNYSLGVHRMTAVGETSSGVQLRSNEIQVEIVSADQGFKAAGQILVPILIVVLVSMLFSFFASYSSRKKIQQLAPGTERNYGAAGGAICPKCYRPFSRNFFSPNMLFGKLERCPFCGKWSIVRARPLSELRAAEAAELEDAQKDQAPVMSDEEKLQKDLEQSRYHDL